MELPVNQYFMVPRKHRLIYQCPRKSKPDHCIRGGIYRGVIVAGIVVIDDGRTGIEYGIRSKQLLQLVAHYESTESLYPEIQEYGCNRCIADIGTAFIEKPVK